LSESFALSSASLLILGMLNSYGYNETKPNQTKTKVVLVTMFIRWFGHGFTIQ
jgi:hypothetical protein